MIYKLNGNGIMAWQYNGGSEMSNAPSWVSLLFKENILCFSKTKQDVGGYALYLGTQYVSITDYVVRLPNKETVLLSENQFKILFIESKEIALDDVSVNFNGKLSKDIHLELLKLPAECYLNVYHEMQSKVFGGVSYSGCGSVC